jgi:hypothetical protein
MAAAAEFLARGVDEFSVGHFRGADRLAGAAGEAVIQVLREAGAGFEDSRSQALHEGDAATG